MNKLTKLFDHCISQIEKQILIYPFEDRDMYCLWMSQQYFLVENSTRYLSLSASKVPTQEKEEFRDWVHHLSEELDHDLLVLKDLEKMSYSMDQVEMNPYTRAIVSTQYYDIETNGPNALLGYALMLEGLSCKVCSVLAERIDTAFGKGKTSYLRLHASVDLEHFPEGMKKISQLNEKQTLIVQRNLVTMTALYSSLLTSLSSQQQKDAFDGQHTALGLR
jgi:hypothetical protein